MLIPVNPYVFDPLSRNGGVKAYTSRVVKASKMPSLKSDGDAIGEQPLEYEPAYKAKNRRQKQEDRRAGQNRRSYQENRLFDTRSAQDRRKHDRRKQAVMNRISSHGLDVMV